MVTLQTFFVVHVGIIDDLVVWCMLNYKLVMVIVCLIPRGQLTTLVLPAIWSLTSKTTWNLGDLIQNSWNRDGG